MFVGQLFGSTQSSGDPQLKKLSLDLLSPATRTSARTKAHDAILATGHVSAAEHFAVARRVLPDGSRSVLHGTIEGLIEPPPS